MSTSVELTEKEKKRLFWASFLALTAAGVGFAFRVAQGGAYGDALKLTNLEIGMIFGATLWPIAITMIGFSLAVDRTGYKIPMMAAFALQVGSAIGTAMSHSYSGLYFSALAAGLAHGIIEAVINPCCAAVYPKDKTKRLTILHAAWPAGMVTGTLLVLIVNALGGGVSWRVHALWMALPATAYALMYLPCRFPVDERVAAGVPFIKMLREVGFLGAALASFMMIFELGTQGGNLGFWKLPDSWFYVSMGLGVVAGGAFGAAVKSVGKPLFFLLCLLMTPIATAEIATDGWIMKLMTPVIEKSLGWNPALGLVFSSAIMLILRVFGSGILSRFSPPALLAISGLFSMIGLFWLSSATGIAILIAFVLYALGQTYYWPCVLGFVSERYPRGGALTLNTVSALGLLSVGIVGLSSLGAAFDKYNHRGAGTALPKMTVVAESPKSFLWDNYKQIDPEKMATYLKTLPPEQAAAETATFKSVESQSGRSVLIFASIFPAILVVAFAAIWIWFKSKGGYKPIDINAPS
jgi:MFS family permease